MTVSNTRTYVVQIRIILPGSESETVFDVLLVPSDKLNLPDGSVKPLQDCTLADLEKFAQDLEKRIWEDYQDATLLDLSLEDDISLNIARVDNLETDPSEASLWMDHMVVLGDRSLPFYRSLLERTAERLEHTEVYPTDEEVDSHPGQEIKAVEDDLELEAQLASAVDVEPKEEASATPAHEEKKEDFEELDVEVAEPELVHEEKEAAEPAVHEPEVEIPDFRILGMRRPVNHKTWTAVDILINELAFRNAQAHALSSLDREVAGVLIGPPPEKQPDGRYVVHISDTIIAKHTKMQGASVTYTPESWRYVNDKLAELYPEDSAIIVGWYHTHPGFGIFLSSMDQFIHQNFFVQIWHVAFVLDPQAGRSGFFCWDRKHENVSRYDFPWPDWAEDSW